MGLEELVPGNTKGAKATTAFLKFLKTEGVTEEYVRVCIERDGSRKCFVSVMDKFGMYLAFTEGKRKATGPKHCNATAMQYYRQAKLWLLDQFPQHRAALEARLLKMGKTLDNFYLTRDGGGFISKAPPCSKTDLKKMLVYLYVNASCSSDYQDAALICLLWYLFGRASDLALLRKPNISIDAGNVLFVRFIRMKPSEEQGLSLFPGTEFETCPMLAMALAMLMQTAPSTDVIDNLPEMQDQAAITLSPDVPLLEILDHPVDTTGLGAPSAAGVEKTTTVYSHVNRVLDRIAAVSGVTAALTSHSFRRGGHNTPMVAANSPRGGSSIVNMSTTNKGFNYIFNTSREYHKASKALSGYDTETKVKALDLKPFDTETQEKIADVQRLLFTTCYRMESAKYNLSQQLLDVLTAYLILHYPLMKKLQLDGQAVRRLESAAVIAGASVTELLAWSSRLAVCQATIPETSQEQETTPITEQSNQSKIIDHQRSLMEHIKRQDERMDNLEAKMDGTSSQDKNRKRQRDSSQEQDKPKRRRGSVTNLHSIWFAWYAQEPRMWQSTISKQ
ncbi:LOW QUALITY PROTEIN: Hypothetical protein PHPALM_13932 [Phytophthora palmivora]|uniref:Uncharacterized protein n=1 Tax=Phytophthora palmivora TaxID=4796 RepID=A0A2P4XW32_9STRA|nr:LOW QUALITY PROTEIN: Hypothetical protein PHPALM_13932 [Phytophthora palmivora]